MRTTFETTLEHHEFSGFAHLDSQFGLDIVDHLEIVENGYSKHHGRLVCVLLFTLIKIYLLSVVVLGSLWRLQRYFQLFRRHWIPSFKLFIVNEAESYL